MSVETSPAAHSEQYDVARFRWHEGGLLQLPVAEEIGDAAIVRLHAPRSGVVIAFTLKKWGQPPEIPDPDSLEDNAVFLRGWNSGAIPLTDETMQGRLWEVKGIYWYANISAVYLNEALPTGKAPFDPVAIGDTTIPATYFKSGILGKTVTTLGYQQSLSG